MSLADATSSCHDLAVGPGDSTLARLAYGILSRFSFEETLVASVTAGTANILTAGAGQFRCKIAAALVCLAAILRRSG